ncbi:MAG: type IV toxin-antitoxin system AbiEi family antitoxin [Acidimicrobiales bacterium]
MAEPTSRRTTRSDRRIPGWAASLLTRFARERPPVITRRDIEAVLTETGLHRDADGTLRELQRLGWLVPTHLKGAWAYLPPGEDVVTDPYVDLRAWRARDRDAVFALAGEAAAWHLGYLDRAFAGPTAVWIPNVRRLPHGLRRHLSVVRLGWRADDADELGPSPLLLHRRHLDLTRWSAGLPAFGPEALVVQLAKRPSSFRAWTGLIDHLHLLAGDCDPTRLSGLLRGQSSSAWQRSAYLLTRGDQRAVAEEVFARRPAGPLPKVQLGTGPNTMWDGEFKVSDALIAPTQQTMGKA